MADNWNTSSDEYEEIERMIGRRLQESERGSVASLNDLAQVLIGEARRLPWPLAHLFVRYYVRPEARSLLPQFVDEVVFGSVPVAEWLRGRILAPDFTLQELISIDVRSVLDVLGPREGDKWRRIRPDRLRWEANEEWMGAPAIVRPELDYRYVAGQHVLDFRLGYGFDLEDVDDISVSTRRWMASRFAAAAWRHGVFGIPRSLNELISVLKLGPENPSEDALLSFQALLAEEQIGPLEDTAVPGFRGPDEWYSSWAQNRT